MPPLPLRGEIADYLERVERDWMEIEPRNRARAIEVAELVEGWFEESINIWIDRDR